MNSRKLLFYRALNGHSYLREWLDGLDSDTRVRIQRRIDRAALGSFGDAKSVGDGIQEMRIHFGPGWRVYYAVDGPEIILLLAGSDKRDQEKTLDLAKALWKEYKENKHADGKLG